MMKKYHINEKILSIPPYISTTWKHISSIHLNPDQEDSFLNVTTTSGLQIQIPDLPSHIKELIFHFHQSFLEKEISPTKSSSSSDNEGSLALGIPIKSELLQHQIELKDTPDLPQEILSKIRGIAKTLGVNFQNISTAVPYCNCPFCQISKALNEDIEEPEEEIVTEEDLRFPTWKVEPLDKERYLVFNEEKQFEVHLKDPIHCTCGEPHCVHIHAVLMT